MTVQFFTVPTTLAASEGAERIRACRRPSRWRIAQRHAHQLSALAKARIAPLPKLGDDNKIHRWYDVEKLTDVRDIDVR